jgi:putative ABC transport system ATP-binding protein
MLLLADEPTGNLGSKNGELIMELSRQLHDDEATVCVVKHDSHHVAQAKRAINLFDGAVTYLGSRFSRIRRLYH